MNSALREKRLEKDLSQEELSRKAKLSGGVVISRYEHGLMPGEAVQRRIARALKVDPRELFG